MESGPQSMAIIIRHPTNDELGIYSQLAEAENWGPCQELTAAVLLQVAAREELYLAEVGGEVVSIIGCIRHGESHGWVGLYICKPEFRGKGYGLALWRASVDAADFKDRTLGLTAVLEQVPNYERSGFKVAYKDFRYTAPAASLLIHQQQQSSAPSPHLCRSVSQADIPAALAYSATCIAADHSAFLSRWLSLPRMKAAMCVLPSGEVCGLGAIRPAGVAGFKIGPLFADSQETALAVMRQLVSLLGLSDDEKAQVRVVIDVSEINPKAIQLVESVVGAVREGFYCVRMYRGEYDWHLTMEKEFANTSWELSF